MSIYYLKVEAVNLSHFVYDTHDISTIRGGSFLLLEAIQKLGGEFKDDLNPISTAASQGLFSFNCEEGDQKRRDNLAIRVLEHLHTQTGGHATFVTAIEKDKGSFQLVLQKLDAQIRRKQWRFPTVAVPKLAVSTKKECYLDGCRPGVVRYGVDPTEADAKISASTYFRREHGRELKHSLLERLLDSDRYAHDPCAKDLGELAKDSTKGLLDGKIAFIHVDGNSFGAIRKATCTTVDARMAFDKAIQKDFREPFLEALVEKASTDSDFKTYLDEEKKEEALRLEVLLWGGDEMTLVVPSWKGWDVIDRFYQHAGKSNFQGIELSHRASLIFCQHNTPILRVRELAEALLTRTKEDIIARIEELPDQDREQVDQKKLTDHRYGDALHYLNLSSFDLLQGSLKNFAARYYKNVPYHQLLMYAATMKVQRPHLKALRRNFARQKVYQIIDIIQKDDVENEAAANKASAIEEVIKQALDLLPGDLRGQTEQALGSLASDGYALWYKLADLWDYILKWEEHG